MIRLRCPLVLASQSPRRRDLLEAIGVPFAVHPSHAEEVWPAGASPSRAVEALALQKAEAVAPSHPDALTLGADTVVVLHDSADEAPASAAVLGKPADAADAVRTLSQLGGRTHQVYSGLALVHPATGRSATASERTRVRFAPLSTDEIDAYVATGSPMDKAGSYGIQDDAGALLIEGIDGDYYNVVGLPLHRLYRTLRAHFSDLLF